ncbi:MAG: hypothetical protein HY033_07330 [Ignavibacteriae bacterium]|nr:hypothetical protein [Ignavibacteria bacterium]MBI3364704.1 hypothetical protein [Ignavibacteriota bacterium]
MKGSHYESLVVCNQGSGKRLIPFLFLLFQRSEPEWMIAALCTGNHPVDSIRFVNRKHRKQSFLPAVSLDEHGSTKR